MELATHQAPLDNSFQKQKRELASKGSLGRRRRPTRSNLRTFCNSPHRASDFQQEDGNTNSYITSVAPMKTVPRLDIHKGSSNGVNGHGKNSLLIGKEEPEWVSLSRKLCAKFIESHLDEKGEETDSSLCDIRVKPVSKVKIPDMDNTPNHAVVSRKGSPDEPQWIRLSRKLCTKFLEEHIEYTYNSPPECPRVINPCSEVPKEIPREIQITEKFDKGVTKSQEVQKEEPEWISLSKKLRAKFIEGHLDDPDKVSFDSQLNASDLEENFSVPALAKKYLECRRQLSNPARDSVDPRKNQPVQNKSDQENYRISGETKSSYASLSRSMPDLSSKGCKTPEEDKRTYFSEDNEFSSLTNPHKCHSQDKHLHPQHYPSPDHHEGIGNEHSGKRHNDEHSSELKYTENSVRNHLLQHQKSSPCVEDLHLRETTIQMKDNYARDIHRYSNGHVHNDHVIDPPHGYHEKAMDVQDGEQRYVEHCADEADLTIHFNEENSSEDMESITSPYSNGDSMMGENLGYENHPQEVYTEALCRNSTQEIQRNSSDRFCSSNEVPTKHESCEKKSEGSDHRSAKFEEDICRIRFRIIPGKKDSSEREGKSLCADENVTYHGTRVKNGKEALDDNCRKGSSSGNESPTPTFDGLNESRFNLSNIIANQINEPMNSSPYTEPSFKSKMSQTIEINDIKGSEDSLENQQKLSRFSDNSRKVVHCVDYDNVAASQQGMSHKTSSINNKIVELPNKFGQNKSQTTNYPDPDKYQNEEIREIESGRILNEDSISLRKESNFQRQCYSKGGTLREFNVGDTESGNRKSSLGKSILPSGNSKPNSYLQDQNEWKNKHSNKATDLHLKPVVKPKETPEKEEAEFKTHFGRSLMVAEMINSATKRADFYNEAYPFNTSSDSSCYSREGNFCGPNSKVHQHSASNKSGFQMEHLYMNYSTEYGKVRKDNRVTKKSLSNTPESLNSSYRAKSLSSLVGHVDSEVSDKFGGSYSDSSLVRVISAEILNCDTSYNDACEMATSKNQSSTSRTENSPLSTASSKSCFRQNGSSRVDDDFFKDTASTSVCPSDSESSTWTMTESNSYVINCSSSANESDLSDCSMSVKCDLKSKTLKESAVTEQRCPSRSESGFYVSFKDSDNDENFNKIGSYQSRAAHEMRKRKDESDCEKNSPSIPPSLRNLFDTPSSSMVPPNLHSSRLLMSKEPPSLYSSVSQMSVPNQRNCGEAVKAKKTERSSSVKIRDIAQGIILTFRKLHSSSSKSSHLSSNHYVDVSHLAESGQKISKDWLLGKGLASSPYAQPMNGSEPIRFNTVHPFFKGMEYATPNARDLGSQSVRSWTKLKPGPSCSSRVHSSDPPVCTGKGEEKKRNQGKCPDVKKKKKRSKDKDHPPSHGKTRLKRPESNNIPNISRKIQQMEDGTFYLVTTVSGDSAVPALYSESVEPRKEMVVPERRPAATGESNC